jgi:hypothetical protein
LISFTIFYLLSLPLATNVQSQVHTAAKQFSQNIGLFMSCLCLKLSALRISQATHSCLL